MKPIEFGIKVIADRGNPFYDAALGWCRLDGEVLKLVYDKAVGQVESWRAGYPDARYMIEPLP